MKKLKLLFAAFVLMSLQACDKPSSECGSCISNSKESSNYCLKKLNEGKNRMEVAVEAFRLQQSCGLSEDSAMDLLSKWDSRR